MTSYICFIFSNTQDWSSLPKQNATKTEEASHVVFAPTDHGTWEEISSPEIPSLRRKVHTGQGSENDRCTGENLVPESSNKMEVKLHGLVISQRQTSAIFWFMHLKCYFIMPWNATQKIKSRERVKNQLNSLMA